MLVYASHALSLHRFHIQRRLMDLTQILEENGLTMQDVDRLVSDIHLERISHSCCERWERLPPHLQLKPNVADDISSSNNTPEQKRYIFLKEWKKIKGSHATYKKLLSALLVIESTDDAERICKMVRESSPSTAAASALPRLIPAEGKKRVHGPRAHPASLHTGMLTALHVGTQLGSNSILLPVAMLLLRFTWNSKM